MLIPSSTLMPSISAGGGRNTSSLSQIAGIQALFDLDATLSASYNGTGSTWSNLIASPYDGSAQTDYDFTKDGPAFTGTPNDPAAYWLFGTNNRITLASGTNTAALNNIHKTTGGQPFTIILAVETPSSYSVTGGWFGTTSTSSPDGIEFRITSASINQLIQRHSSGNGLSTPFSSTPSAGAVHLMAFAMDYTGGALKTALDARSFTTKTLSKGTTTADATAAFGIGWSGVNDSLVSGSIIYGAYSFAKILSDSELSAVIDVLNSRHNRTYA